MTNSRSLKLPDQDAGPRAQFHLTPTRHRALFRAGSAGSHSHERHLSWVVPVVRSAYGMPSVHAVIGPSASSNCPLSPSPLRNAKRFSGSQSPSLMAVRRVRFTGFASYRGAR
jgi:hypothetical protein